MAIQGRNTGGKTSFLNALKWCLYGEVGTRADTEMPLLKLFNSNAIAEGEDLMRVEVEALIKGEPFTIIREARRRFPNSKPNSDNDFTVNFVVKKDGQVLSEDHSNKVINRIAPKIISRFFLFDGELLKEYEDLIEQRNRRSTFPLVEAIEDVLGLPALKTATRFLDKALSLADRNVSQKAQSNTQTKNLSLKLDTLNTQRDQAVEQLTETEAKLEKLERGKSGLEKEVNEEREMDVLRGEIKANEEQRERLAKDIDQYQNQLKELSSQAWKDGIHLALTKRQTQIEQDLSALSDQHENFIVEEHDFQSLKHIIDSGHCDTCGQDVSETHLDTIQSKIDVMIRSHEDRKAQYESLQEKNFQARKVRGLLGQVRPIFERYTAAYEQVLHHSNELTRLAENHDRMKAEAQNEDLEAVRKRRERLEQTTREIGVLRDHISSLTNTIADHDRNIEQLVADINAKEGSKEVEAATDVKRKLETLKKVFDVGREELREEMRKHVEDYASRSYKAMIHEGDHENVRISPKTYELSIVNSRGLPVTEPSSGATQVLALALIVALGKAGRPIGPIVMDSPFGRLDEAHRGRVLRYLPRQASQLVLLYHSGELQPATLNTVKNRIGCAYTIQKAEEGRSKLKEGEA
jgi:DNA sulfur modification protein DndD